MVKKNLKISEKTRKTVHMLSGVVAVLSLVVTLILSPIGEFFFKDTESAPPPTQSETHATQAQSPYKAKKNYTFFLDKTVFSRSVNGDVTTIRAIKNNSVKMTITPLHGTSYTKLCTDTKLYANEIFEYSQLNVTTIYSVYRTKENGNIVTVYCIDDGLGSSVEIKYTFPEGDTETEKNFDILLSMFKFI